MDLGKKPTKDEAERFVLWYDGNRRVTPNEDGSAPSNDEGVEFPSIVFYLTPLNGRAQRRIADEMMEIDQRSGKAVMRTGTAMATRVRHGVIAVEGVTLKGRPIGVMTDDLYDALPGWVNEAVAARVAQISGDTPEEEEREVFANGSPEK